jgi:two-component system cell cycle sensor histidine kinase/response regulator CckA
MSRNHDGPAERGAIRVLLVGEAGSVAELRKELLRGGYDPAGLQVDSEAGLSAALDDGRWDVALCEDGSGAFGGPAALRLIKRRRPDLPVIVVSSLFGESIAAAAMKAGADDFIARGYLARLVPAVEREIGAVRARRGWEEAAHGLLEIQSRSDAFMNNSPTVAFMKDESGRLVYVNRGFEEVFHTRLQDVHGRLDADLFAPPTAAQARENDLAVLAADRPMQFEEHVTTPDGQRSWLVSRFPFKDASGRRFVGGVAVDITDRQKAEETLRESQALLERAQEVGRIGSWVSGLSENSLTWSKETCRIFGVDPAKFDGRLSTFFERVHPADRDAVETAVREALESDRTYRIEHRVVRGDGSEVWVYERADVVRDASGKAVRLEGIVQDITERRSLEEQFLQAQKMEAIGRLAGGIAHDFNNLLTAILGYTDLLLQQVGSADAMRDDLEQIQRAGDRAAALTRQLLAFSRRQMLEPKVIDVNVTVRHLEKMLRRVLGEDVLLVTSLDTDLDLVRADPGQLEQVIVNLVVNSRDAMPSGGTITISTRGAVLDDALDFGRYAIEPGAYVVLQVVDTGMGMDAATLARIFEPFFTTKEKGKGTGLGLATAYGIIKQSGGYIACDSEPGSGTRFQIYLPRSFERAEEGSVGLRGDREGLKGSETVLLVEDEEGVRRLSRRLLEAHGYHVLEASGGEQALEFAVRYPDPIHLLLTDVVMPGMSGPEVAGQIQELRPEIKILFMTGYSDATVTGLAPDVPLLQKPFTPDALAHRVRETLAS